MLVIKSAFDPWSLFYWIWIFTLLTGKLPKLGSGCVSVDRPGSPTRYESLPKDLGCRCKDGGRGTVMMGLDNRGGVMLWILNVNGVCSEGFNRCQTMNRSMCCSNRRSCQHRISCSEKKERITIPTSNVMVKSDCYKNRLTFSAIYETVNPNIFEWLILNRYVVFLPYWHQTMFRYQVGGGHIAIKRRKKG